MPWYDNQSWQFIGVVVSAIIGIVSMSLPYFLPVGKNNKEKLSFAYHSLIQSESLGCAGSFSLFALFFITSYFLYLLLMRMFFLPHSVDQITLFITSIAIVFITYVFFIIFKHTQLLLVLIFHFCSMTLVFGLLIVSFKIGTFSYQDFTFVKLFIVQHFPDVIHFIVQNFPIVKTIPLQLKVIPDVTIKDFETAHKWFILGYGVSLFVFLFLYGFYKRSESKRASAFAYMSAEKRQIILQGLEKKDKEAVIQLRQKQIDLQGLEKQDKETTIELRQKQIDLQRLEKQDKEAAIQLKYQQIGLQRLDEQDKAVTIKLKYQQIDLQGLEKQDREATIQLKRQTLCEQELDTEKKRISYALELSALLAKTIQPDADYAARSELIKYYLPDFLELGMKDTSDIILPHLNSKGSRNSQATSSIHPIDNQSGNSVQSLKRQKLSSTSSTKKAKISSSPPLHPRSQAIDQSYNGHTVISHSLSTPLAGNGLQQPSQLIKVPDLRNKDLFSALEMASNVGMKIVPIGEDASRLDLKPGIIVSQNPLPFKHIAVELNGKPENRPTIKVILSGRASIKPTTPPPLMRRSDSTEQSDKTSLDTEIHEPLNKRHAKKQKKHNKKAKKGKNKK